MGNDNVHEMPLDTNKLYREVIRMADGYFASNVRNDEKMLWDQIVNALINYGIMSQSSRTVQAELDIGTIITTANKILTARKEFFDKR
jgi:hypothetical protein